MYEYHFINFIQMIVDCGYNGKDMNGCEGAHSGSYGRVFTSKLGGQSPHEATYPYLDTQPKLSCPSGKAVYNSGAYVKTPLEDYQCSEAKLMQLVSWVLVCILKLSDD